MCRFRAGTANGAAFRLLSPTWKAGAGWIPGAAAVGDGSYATLPGANLWGLVPVTVLFLAPVAVSALRAGGGGRIVGPDSPPSRSRRGPR